MNKLETAAYQALVALESITRHFTRGPSSIADSVARGEAHKAIAALSEALEHPERDPVAWLNFNAATGDTSASLNCESELASTPLYTACRNPIPLSDGEILGMWFDSGFPNKVIKLARMVESAHGIRERA